MSEERKDASKSSELPEQDTAEISPTPDISENIQTCQVELKAAESSGDADKADNSEFSTQSTETEISEEQKDSSRIGELPEQDLTEASSNIEIKAPESTEATDKADISEMSKPGEQSNEIEQLVSSMNIYPTSGDGSPLEGAVGYSDSPLSDSTVDKLNDIAKALDSCRLHSGKLVVFQRYFRAPKLDFFVRPENRRRHNAAEGTANPKSSEPQNVDADEEFRSFIRFIRTNVPLPKATVNQAGAIIGIPQYIPSVKELLENEDEGFTNFPPDQSHSFGSSSTIPIDQVYDEDSFSPSNLRFYTADGATTGFLGVSDENSPELSTEDRRWQRMLGISQPEDIPGRSPESTTASAGSYQELRRRGYLRLSPSELEPQVSNTDSIPKRKISQDSSGDGSERHRWLSGESSVDLEMYMTAEPTEDIDEGSDLPIPDMFLPDSFGVQDLNPEVPTLSESSDAHDPSPTTTDEITDSDLPETSKYETRE